MIPSTIAFFAGILIFQFLPTLPNLLVTVIIFGALGGLIVILQHHKHKNIIRFCCIAMCGFLYVLLWAKHIDRWHLPPAIEKQNILITGYIDSLPAAKENHISFDFIATTIDGKPINQHPKLHLSWYKHESENEAANTEPEKPSLHTSLLAGDKWQLTVRLKRPHSTLNPGSFDYEKYLWQHQIRATGNVVDVDSVTGNNQNQLLSDPAKPPPTRYSILRLRHQLENKINLALTNQPLTPMITALVIGNQSGISKEQWQIFRDTGTSYLMAIAGLHICLAAGVIFMLVQYLWRRIPCLVLRLPAREAAAIFGLIAAVTYSTLSGFSIPTQRALIMLSVFTCALLSRSQTSPWYALCLALCIVLLIDPLAALAAGFWLSFIAVILIFYVTAGRLRLENSWWHKYSRMQWAITLGLAPITLIFFSHASLITFVANTLAMPGVCSFVVPLSILGSLLLLASPSLGQMILLLAEKLMELIWWWLKWWALFPQLNWHQAVVNWWTGAFAIVGVLLLLAPRGFGGKWMGIVWLCPLIFYAPPQPKPGEFWLNVLDVGQGLATAIQTHHHTLVYDTGPKFSESDSGENIVAPFLQTAGINKVDTIIVSHSDDDHSGGVESIRRLMRVDKILASDTTQLSSTIDKAQITPCHQGQEWNWDGVTFKILHPLPNTPVAGNDTSCVLRVDNGNHSILLLGDIPKAQEKLLLKRETAKKMQTSVVVAAHHGSATSSSPAFVDAVNAQYAVFAAGYKNRFNFPTASVVERYKKQGAKMLTTADTGAITFKFGQSPRPIEALSYRKFIQRYWHDRKSVVE